MWCCVSHEFSKSASKSPDKIAVIQAEDDTRFTYSEILQAVDSLSLRLRFILEGLRSTDKSANAPKIVGIYMIPSVEYIISVLSVMRCGEAFMPLDPSWPKERILSVVSSSTANLIICDSILSDGNNNGHISKNHWLIDRGGCSVFVYSMEDNDNKHFGHSSLLWPCGNKNPRSFCYLMYTSGSTGKPKGVCGTEQGLVNRFLWMQDMYPLCGEETLLFKTSIGFIDHLQEILGALLTSCTLVIPSFNVLKQNVLSIADYLQDYSINRLVAVPSLMRILLPTLQSSHIISIQSSLKLLILSGEILHLSLWKSLTKLLPHTDILNLYGSTEVSGDCTYFDCKKLSSILKTESLSSVPIGIPIPNCEVMLVGENTPSIGEIYVAGLCIAAGYLNHDIMPLNTVKKLPESSFCHSINDNESRHYFKTGDFAKQLPGGDLVFIGRNDRTVKVNGSRIALEEVENTIRTHEEVDDAALIFGEGEGEVERLEAFIVMKSAHGFDDNWSSCFRGWLVDRLPLPMIPNRLVFVDSLPMTSSQKVDYKLLASSTCSMLDNVTESEQTPNGNLLQTIKEAFCDALAVENISNNDDFFTMGGDSISAAHTCHKLGINMKLLYTFPTPLKLVTALMDPKTKVPTRLHTEVSVGGPQGTHLKTNKPHGRLLGEPDAENHYPHKVIKRDGDLNVSFAISRGNKIMSGENYDISKFYQETRVGEPKGSITKLWKVHMESCVDASPLIVVRDDEMFVYIGSHSRKFVCIKASSGFVQWEVQLEGRIECSAAILGDFSMVVVGCYKGKIYFLNSLDGSIGWTFQTGGEVKSQPVVDKQRNLVWCGSYDHTLYALDYRNYCCVYKLDCGGSIYGSPAINEVDERLYFASTNGCLTALSLKAVPFSVLWMQDLGAPVFGSLSVNYNNGNVICCLVNGHIVAVDVNGSILWRGITEGPIFAGPCLSRVLYNQVVICSRDGGVYSFGLDTGNLVWKHDLGDPISSSAYIDENLRLICVCTASGSVVVSTIQGEEFGRADMKGDIFSSPVMLSGRIFVGCRDDYLHCLGVQIDP
ncbi:putative acyl-activating enzyme 19 [Bidens hawaiensis]|uniref:putative acyl-activating enzyme 19 n=1 Tax=Bidens hawaiensis TaxID=980011 RepID=UPI004049AC8D